MDIDRLKTSLQLHEGFRSLPYVDTKGKITIGYGRNLTDNPLTKDEGWWLSQPWVDDAVTHAPLLVHNWDHLGDARQNVLIELVYNIGLTGALKFQKMRAALDAGDWHEARMELYASKWAKDVGAARSDNMGLQLETGEFA